MWDGDRDERGDGQKGGRREEEVADAASRGHAYEDRTGDGTETPHNVEYGDEACACRGDRCAGNDVSGGEACSESEAHAEERDVCRTEAHPGHSKASDRGGG